MECLTETAICSQLAGRDLFGQWAQPSPGQTAAFLGRGARSTAGPCQGSRGPSAPGQNKHPFVPCSQLNGLHEKKKLSPSTQSEVGIQKIIPKLENGEEAHLNGIPRYLQELKLLDNIKNLPLDTYLVPNAMAFWVFLKELITVTEWQTGCSQQWVLKLKDTLSQGTANCSFYPVSAASSGSLPQKYTERFCLSWAHLPLRGLRDAHTPSPASCHPFWQGWGQGIAGSCLHSLPPHCIPAGTSQGFIPICGCNISSCCRKLRSLCKTQRHWHTAPGLQAINGSN